jgi:hypothetical protein
MSDSGAAGRGGQLRIVILVAEGADSEGRLRDARPSIRTYSYTELLSRFGPGPELTVSDTRGGSHRILLERLGPLTEDAQFGFVFQWFEDALPPAIADRVEPLPEGYPSGPFTLNTLGGVEIQPGVFMIRL